MYRESVTLKLRWVVVLRDSKALEMALGTLQGYLQHRGPLPAWSWEKLYYDGACQKLGFDSQKLTRQHLKAHSLYRTCDLQFADITSHFLLGHDVHLLNIEGYALSAYFLFLLIFQQHIHTKHNGVITNDYRGDCNSSRGGHWPPR